jgi:hypothetical protein
MEAVPCPTPVTVPPTTVATEPLLLVQPPPGIPSLSSVVNPTHTWVVPVIGPGAGLTVKPNVLLHPVPNEYEIIAVPALTPVTVPVNTEATAALLVPHTPPEDPSDKKVVAPTHMLLVPLIGPGLGLTVTVATAIQPDPKEYVIIAVPCETPVTAPEPEFTEAIEDELLVQVPELGKSFRLVTRPTHTDLVPPITPGAVVTINVEVM